MALVEPKARPQAFGRRLALTYQQAVRARATRRGHGRARKRCGRENRKAAGKRRRVYRRWLDSRAGSDSTRPKSSWCGRSPRAPSTAACFLISRRWAAGMRGAASAWRSTRCSPSSPMKRSRDSRTGSRHRTHSSRRACSLPPNRSRPPRARTSHRRGSSHSCAVTTAIRADIAPLQIRAPATELLHDSDQLATIREIGAALTRSGRPILVVEGPLGSGRATACATAAERAAARARPRDDRCRGAARALVALQREELLAPA